MKFFIFKLIFFFAFLMTIVISCSKDNEIDSSNDLLISSPYGDETIIIGNEITIKWTSSISSKMDIDLYMGAELIRNIAADVENNSSFEWELLESTPIGKGYHVRITSIENERCYCESKHGINILPKPETSNFTDIRDGKIYKTVKIGDQWWMAENFNYDLAEGYFGYDETVDERDSYGKLYTLEAAIRNCPEGWHLPTDEEWMELESYLGLNENELNKENDRGKYVGNLLKLDGGTGFDITYGGYRNSGYDYNGHFGWEAHFWTSTITNEGEIVRVVSKLTSGITRVIAQFHGGSSVRYIKDIE